MDDKGKHRVMTIPTNEEIDSFVGGVRAKNTHKSPSDPCKPFNGYVGSWFCKMPMLLAQIWPTNATSDFIAHFINFENRTNLIRIQNGMEMASVCVCNQNMFWSSSNI